MGMLQEWAWLPYPAAKNTWMSKKRGTAATHWSQSSGRASPPQTQRIYSKKKRDEDGELQPRSPRVHRLTTIKKSQLIGLGSVRTPPAAGHGHHLHPETFWWPLARGDSTGTALMAPGTCLESHLAAPCSCCLRNIDHPPAH